MDLLVEEEKLPCELHEWLQRNEQGISLFNRLRTIEERNIAIRNTVIKNDITFYNYDFSQIDLLQYTVQWFLNKNIPYIFDSPAYMTIVQFIEGLPHEFNPMIFLKHTGKLAKTDNEESVLPIFELSVYNENSCFLSSYSWTPLFKSLFKNDKRVQDFFKNNTVYTYNQTELLVKHKLNHSPKLELSLKAKDDEYEEMKSPVYEKWKNSPGSRGIVIKTIRNSIGMRFTMLKNKEQVFAIDTDKREFGYVLEKAVIVQYPNKDSISILKMIEKHIDDLEFFKAPFIALQGLFVEQLEQIQLEAEKQGSDIQTLITTLSKTTKEKNATLTTGNLTVDDDKVEAVKEIADSYDVEELKGLIIRKDEVLEVLYNISFDEDETNESKVRLVIGYIGELIYERYLKALGKEYRYTAAEGIGDYDFYNITDKTYIDIKTTLYSLKDGVAPFYLHRSQNVFMQKNPKEKYHIVRISLNDLHLDKDYADIRDTYGKDVNPMTDERLNKACKKLADKYWRGSLISDFDSASPEYAIRIEKKDRNG